MRARVLASSAFPFADQVFVGRPAILARVAEAWRASPIRVHDYADASVVTAGATTFAEFTIRGAIADAGAAGELAFAVRGVLRLDVDPGSGKIAAMREYLDPAAASVARPPRAMLRKVHAAMQAKSADALADLFAVDGIHELGFEVPNRPKQLVGREAVRAAYTAGWRDHPLVLHAIDDALVFQALDPEVVIGQWRARATHGDTPVSLTGLLILRVRANAIVHCYDYMDALGISRALGRAPFATS